MEYIYLILALVCMYIILASALNLVAGFGGMFSLAHGAFFGLGAYAYALFVTRVCDSFWLAILAAMLVSAILAAVFGFFSVRLRGDQFLLSTLALQIVILTVFRNWTSVTGGPYGIVGVPRPSLFGRTLSSSPTMLLLTMAVMACVLFVLALVIRSSFFRDLRAVRDDWQAAESLGIYPRPCRIAVLSMSGSVAAISGSIYASWFGFIDPSSFTLDESIFIFVVVSVGGLSSFAGPIVGAALLVVLPELLRFSPLPDSIAANIRQILYALALVGMVMCRPRGLLGKYRLE